eukprot:5111607-Amphidinium_carterae.1
MRGSRLEQRQDKGGRSSGQAQRGRENKLETQQYGQDPRVGTGSQDLHPANWLSVICRDWP